MAAGWARTRLADLRSSALPTGVLKVRLLLDSELTFVSSNPLVRMPIKKPP